MSTHSELAHSWPALVFAASIVAVFVSLVPGCDWLRYLSGALLVASFVPCCLIRDWWVGR